MDTQQKNRNEEENDDRNDSEIPNNWGSLAFDVESKEPHFEEHSTEIFRIHPKRPLQSLIAGYDSLKMVMYVSRVDFIVELFDELGISKAEIIVGDSMVTKHRSDTQPEVFLRLAELIQDEKLTIRSPTKNREFHEKWILAESESEFADIFGTANLTSRGSARSGKQSNQARRRKVSGRFHESPLYQDCLKKYQWYLDNSEVFLEDLVELLKKDDAPRIEIVERWISYTGSNLSADSTKVQALVNEFQERAMMNSSDPDIIVTELTTEANTAILEEVERILGPSGLQREGRRIFAHTQPFLDSRVSTFPLMSINNDAVVLRVGNDTVSRTAEEYNHQEIKRGIESIHKYVNTIDRASSKNPGVAKKSIYETILYFLTSPFHHHYMTKGKAILGWDYERGPKPLAIYGNTKNGKTYLLKYCSRLLTGKNNIVSAYEDENFTPKQIKNLLSWSSLFPIIFDDISDTKWGKQHMDQIGRNYWDSWWQRGKNHSQLIVTSNKRVPQGQLKGRMKEIVMDARFKDTTDNIRHVSSIIAEDNPIFLYFSKMYIEVMDGNQDAYDHTDCMHIGRLVMERLYEMVDMSIPSFFPNEPLEDVVDGNALHWISLLNDGFVSWKRTAQGELHLTFLNEERPFEVTRHMDLIPEYLGPKQSGKKVILPVPEEFSSWLSSSRESIEVNWLQRRKIKKILKFG